jgi:hypothetical protein
MSMSKRREDASSRPVVWRNVEKSLMGSRIIVTRALSSLLHSDNVISSSRVEESRVIMSLSFPTNKNANIFVAGLSSWPCKMRHISSPSKDREGDVYDVPWSLIYKRMQDFRISLSIKPPVGEPMNSQ